MITFPSTPLTYIQFWKALAEAHVKIKHSDDQKQFCLINKNSDPFANKWDLSELQDGLNSKIRIDFKQDKYCMALVNAETENNPTPGVQTIRPFDCGFLILTKVSPGNLDEKMNAFNDSFLIGEAMMAWKADYLNRTRGQWQNFKYGTEQVMDGSIVGTAFIFSYGVRTGIALTAADFGGYTPLTS